MENRKSIQDQVKQFEQLEDSQVSVEKKLDELIMLLEKSNLDSETLSRLQDKFVAAAEQTKSSDNNFKVFQNLDDNISTRLELADNLENLLSSYNVDSKVSKKYLFAEKVSKFVLILIAVALMVLGYALIVMPASPEFEMFTIFYFTRDDGFTLMDLIALLIVFAGVYLFIRAIIKTNSPD